MSVYFDIHGCIFVCIRKYSCTSLKTHHAQWEISEHISFKLRITTPVMQKLTRGCEDGLD